MTLILDFSIEHLQTAFEANKCNPFELGGSPDGLDTSSNKGRGKKSSRRGKISSKGSKKK